MASSSSSSPPRRKCHHISLDEINDATNNFSNKNLLGKGGEGDVYIAEIRIDRLLIQVAVKRLSKPKLTENFQSEIKIVSKFQHPNVVSLLGYCDESGEKILLYEYMEKGSLSSYIKEKSSISLSWQQRLRICLDAARGLQHIHVETDEFPKGIIHRDVKPDNILLDKNWVAKISDFGLLKLSIVGQTQSTMATGLKGTSRYFAPEYVMNRSISRAADVYSFGVLLFQVLCLKFPWDRGDESYYFMEDEDLGDWALQNVDSRIKLGIGDDSLMAFTAIVGKSLKADRRERPTMDMVVLGLENALKFQLLEDEGEQFQVAIDFDAREPAASESDGKSGPESPRLARQENCDCVSLEKIRHATDNFNERNIIGEGRKGVVYWAKIRLGEKMTEVAVRLKSNYKIHTFGLEITTVSKIHHPNIVSLLGYCDESDRSLLLYEYMENRSLSSYLEYSPISLSWRRRLCICLGTARGLQYLHTKTTDEFPKGIIHRDVNPASILLNNNWEAKLSDIDFVTLYDSFQGIYTVHNKEYHAPEYLMFGTATKKIDVYAFGMVLIQVLCQKFPWRNNDYAKDNDLGIWAQENVVPRLKEEICDDSLKTFTAVIGKCMDTDYKKRPTMNEVVYDLENVLECKECPENEAMQLPSARELGEETIGVRSQGSQDKRGSGSRRSTQFINSMRFWWRHN